MDIDELLIILEKNRSKLTKLEDDFYQKIKGRIAELEDLKKDADDDEISRIDDEIRTIKRIQRKIFETRTSKIIRAAWAKVCGESVGSENLTGIERNLFENLVKIISDFRDVLMGEGKTGIETEGETRKGREGGGENAEELGKPGSGFEVVRIKMNVGKFEGVDGKTYKLSREDVVTLPTLNAKALIKADAAEAISWRDER